MKISLRLPQPFIALIAGILLTLSFAPYHYYILSIISLKILIFSLRHTTPKRAAWYGWLYGLGFFGSGVYWVFISIHQYGQVNSVVAFAITALFILFLACFVALPTYLLQKFFPKDSNSKWLIAFPALWVIFEWIRSWLGTGFPWLLLGYSQTNSLLSGFIPIIGVYGESFLIVFSAGLLAQALSYHRGLPLILLAILWIAGFALKSVIWTQPIFDGTHAGKEGRISVTLIQGNVAQSLKWNADQAENTINLYKDLSANHWQSRLIIWPETAIPLWWSQVTSELFDFAQTARTHHVSIIAGVPIDKKINDKWYYYNGIKVLGSDRGEYLKRHLVPFGEYVPFNLTKLLGFLNIPMSGFNQGPAQQPLLDIEGIKIAPFICYEIAYTSLLQSELPQANLLVTISDDAWFNHSAALAQHLQMAQFAALVSGRYMLVSTNTGITAIINAKGKIIKQAPIDQMATLTGDVAMMQGATPWVKIGNIPLIILMIVLLLVALSARDS